LDDAVSDGRVQQSRVDSLRRLLSTTASR
ncbi:MAG: ribosome small subunit-dependent GTPase A, partial [Cutibacterium sp.]|nr:ribosome small subunit-dependent GTPase A [Cutibacterium sp.]